MADLAVEAGHLGPEEERGARFVRDDELVVRTLAAHAPALLRTARRYSLCADDAHDAYARATEIFLRRAGSLRSETVVGWLHQVVRNEALAVRRSRLRLVGAEEADLDAREAEHGPAPDERALRRERTEQAAEAFAALKPHEALALWLKAQGLSYQEIAERQGWTYTKVNRCLAEGRRAFLTRYAGLESGEQCRRFEPLLSALVDGEAGGRELRELRRHLRRCAGCRSALVELRTSGPSLGGLLPVGVGAAGVAAGLRHHTARLLARLHDLLGAAPERTSSSLMRWQSMLEAASAPKLAAVAVSLAAAAGGGVAAVGRSAPPAKHHAPARTAAPAPAVVTRPPGPAPAPVHRTRHHHHRHASAAPAVAPVTTPPPATPPPPAAPPPPASGGSPEFGVEGSP